MSIPLLPSLKPATVNPLWFSADQPVDDESDISALEQSQRVWRARITQTFSDVVPCGKIVLEEPDEEDGDEIEDEEDEDNEDDISIDTSDEEDVDEDDDTNVRSPNAHHSSAI